MQSKKVGIKDIAEATHVSAGTVHRALNGKAGVGEATRKRILETAGAMGYQPNMNASLLKRKPLRIAGAFPAYTEQNRYFYPYVWQGFRECMEEMADYNIKAVEVPYGAGRGTGSQREALLALWEEQQDQIDGLITIGHLDCQDSAVLKQFTEKGIPVILACDDMPEVERMCCVQADHEMTGRMVAELLSGQIPPDSQVLVCAGERGVPSHDQTVQGLESYVQEAGLSWELVNVYGNDTRAVAAQVEALLEKMPRIRAAYSVNARNSQVLCQAVMKQERAGTLRIVTSDIFPENVQALKAGLCHNIAYKNPRQQAYQAARLMLDYLLKRQKPREEIQYVNSEIVFRSNVHVYECM